MKTLIFSLSFFLLLTLSNSSYAIESSKYVVDDELVEQLFASSSEIDFLVSPQMVGEELVGFFGVQSGSKEESTQLMAGIIAIASVVLAVGLIFPIHRFIIGTGGKPLKIFALYCITLGGCGVITLVDGILLLMDSHGSKYMGNSKFIMWN